MARSETSLLRPAGFPKRTGGVKSRNLLEVLGKGSECERLRTEMIAGSYPYVKVEFEAVNGK